MGHRVPCLAGLVAISACVQLPEEPSGERSVARGGRAAGGGWAGEVEAGVADGRVRIQSLAYDMDAWETHVSACFEATFVADRGSDLSAAYRYALPRGAVLHAAEVFLADAERWERAETLGRREGEEVFEEVIEPEPVPRDPLLVQGIGPSQQRARVYPVGAGQPLSARFCYTHVVEDDGRGERIRIPLGDPEDPTERWADRVSVSVRLHEERWSTVRWSGEAVEVATALEAGPTESRFAAAGLPLGSELVLEMEGQTDGSPLVALRYESPEPTVEDHVFVRWMPDLSEYPSTAPHRRNVVFVLDHSGSMEGAKLRLAVRAVEEALGDLDREDRYGLVAFDDGVEVFRETMTAGDDVGEAMDWLDATRVGGSTNIGAALATGARIGATSPAEGDAIDLFIVTDGLPTAGPRSAEGILHDVEFAAPGRAFRVFGVGLGHDLDQFLLNELAHRTGGEATFALDDATIEEQVLDLFLRARSGGAEDVVVEVAGGGIGEAERFAFRRVFPGMTLDLAAGGPSIGGSINLTFSALAPDGTEVEVEDAVAPMSGEGERFLRVPPLAAKARADRLDRTMDEEGETAERLSQAVVLAKRYGVLTRYSSLLALEDEEMYAEFGIDRIERDPAGVALEPVRDSTEDESRIGGEGVRDTSGGADADADWDSADADWDAAPDGSAAGCGCRAASTGTDLSGFFVLVPIAFVALLFAGRRPRRRAGD